MPDAPHPDPPESILWVNGIKRLAVLLGCIVVALLVGMLLPPLAIVMMYPGLIIVPVVAFLLTSQVSVPQSYFKWTLEILLGYAIYQLFFLVLTQITFGAPVSPFDPRLDDLILWAGVALPYLLFMVFILIRKILEDTKSTSSF